MIIEGLPAWLALTVIIIGIPLALFLPGFFIVKAFFRELDFIERIGLSVILSISVTILTALFLGFNRQMQEFTGGITPVNMLIYLLSITAILACVYVLRRSVMHDAKVYKKHRK